MYLDGVSFVRTGAANNSDMSLARRRFSGASLHSHDDAASYARSLQQMGLPWGMIVSRLQREGKWADFNRI